MPLLSVSQLIDCMRQAILTSHDLKLADKLSETTIVDRLFGGYLRNTIECNTCGYMSLTLNKFLDLSLEVSFIGNSCLLKIHSSARFYGVECTMIYMISHSFVIPIRFPREWILWKRPSNGSRAQRHFAKRRVGCVVIVIKKDGYVH
jgi:hypothetical protein